eukprot:COSAG02_NODE_5182_length_4563_cov_4.094982_1_plen_167_part_10
MDPTELIWNAIERNDPPAVGRYLGADGDPNCKNILGDPALVVAARFGRTDITKMLVEADASLELRDSNGWTALIAAAIGGHLEIVQYLLRAGSDPLATCKEGKSAKQWAENPLPYAKKTQAHVQIAALLAAPPPAPAPAAAPAPQAWAPPSAQPVDPRKVDQLVDMG